MVTRHPLEKVPVDVIGKPPKTLIQQLNPLLGKKIALNYFVSLIFLNSTNTDMVYKYTLLWTVPQLSMSWLACCIFLFN